MSTPFFEVCANSVVSAIAAFKGGANRIELCSELQLGGITSSASTITEVIKSVSIPVHVLIRPRSGNFTYNQFEFEVMKHDIEFALNVGAAGVVFGILNKNHRVDIEKCRELVEIARPMKVTFHRAFDCIFNQIQALEDVIETGADCILTSGGKKTAVAGAINIAKLIKNSKGRIGIMAGSGLNPSNVIGLIKKTGVSMVHASCTVEKNKKNPNALLSVINDSDFYSETSVKKVRDMVRCLNQL